MSNPGRPIALGESAPHIASLLRQFKRDPRAVQRLVERIREIAADLVEPAAADLVEYCDYILSCDLKEGNLSTHAHDALLLSVAALHPDLVVGAEVRAGRKKGGARTAESRAAHTAQRANAIESEFGKLCEAKRAERNIAGIIAAKLGVHPSTVRKHLRKMRARA